MFFSNSRSNLILASTSVRLGMNSRNWSFTKWKCSGAQGKRRLNCHWPPFVISTGVECGMEREAVEKSLDCTNSRFLHCAHLPHSFGFGRNDKTPRNGSRFPFNSFEPILQV